MAEYILGFDVGMKRIGVAVGQRILNTATPLSVINAKQGKPDWAEVAKVFNEWQPSACVVGEPYLPNNPNHPIIQAAKKFSAQLSHRYNIPVHRMNEHLTTREAWALSEEQPDNVGKKIDAIAAKLILESWLRQ